jgi:hypothetical protein
MGPVLSADALQIHHPDIQLVNQGCRLKWIRSTLSSHALAGGPVQFAINQRDQLLQSLLITQIPSLEQCCDLVRGFRNHTQICLCVPQIFLLP